MVTSSYTPTVIIWGEIQFATTLLKRSRGILPRPISIVRLRWTFGETSCFCKHPVYAVRRVRGVPTPIHVHPPPLSSRLQTVHGPRWRGGASSPRKRVKPDGFECPVEIRKPCAGSSPTRAGAPPADGRNRFPPWSPPRFPQTTSRCANLFSPRAQKALDGVHHARTIIFVESRPPCIVRGVSVPATGAGTRNLWAAEKNRPPQIFQNSIIEFESTNTIARNGRRRNVSDVDARGRR